MAKFKLETLTNVNVYNEVNERIIQEARTFIIDADTEQQVMDIVTDELDVTEVISVTKL